MRGLFRDDIHGNHRRFGIERKTIAAVDQCLAIRLTSTAPDGLNFDVSLTRPLKGFAPPVVRGGGELVLDGQAQYENPKSPYLGTKFRTILKALPGISSGSPVDTKGAITYTAL